jgi:hypothetical protein
MTTKLENLKRAIKKIDKEFLRKKDKENKVFLKKRGNLIKKFSKK